MCDIKKKRNNSKYERLNPEHHSNDNFLIELQRGVISVPERPGEVLEKQKTARWGHQTMESAAPSRTSRNSQETH